MFDLLKPVYVSQKTLVSSLFVALGIDNIQKISYCMSRVRISIDSKSILSDDNVFLEMNAKGVIHQDESIHLIFGQQSAILGEQLQYLHQIFTHDTILPLLFSIQGKTYITNIQINSNNVNLFFNKNITYNSLYKKTLENNKSIHFNKDYISISCDNPQELSILFLYAILHWELIQSIYIFKAIPIENIVSEELKNNDIYITLKKTKSSYQFDYLGLSAKINSLEPNQLIIVNSNTDLFQIISKYIRFHKK